MNFRTYEQDDFSLVEAFIKECGIKEFPLFSLKQGTATLVEENGLIGLGMQWRNALHPRTLVVDILVTPARRREGIGTQIYRRLRETFPSRSDDFALDIRGRSVEGFALSLGFKHYLSCFHNIFDIDLFKHVEAPYKIQRLEDFYSESREVRRQKIRAFHCSIYDRDHEPYLPVTKNKEVRYDYFNEGNPEYGAVILKGEEIIGCSLAYLNFEEEVESKISDVTGLHGYAIGENVGEEALLIQALYSFQMKLLKTSGLRHVYIEFDSIEATSELMLNWLPYHQPPLLRFQKVPG